MTSRLEFEPHEVPMLVEACRTVDELDRLAAAGRTEPATVVGSRGQLVPHPLWAELRRHRTVLAQLLRQLQPPAEAVNGASLSQWGRTLRRRQLERRRVAS
jgi:hypothetical protein